MNPFQWYVGKHLSLDGAQHVVEGIEIAGQSLAFRVANARTREIRYLSLFDLLGLEAGGFASAEPHSHEGCR